jgi:hypothetical protein
MIFQEKPWDGNAFPTRAQWDEYLDECDALYEEPLSCAEQDLIVDDYYMQVATMIGGTVQ